MKKFILSLLISFFIATPAMAAWTVTATTCAGQPFSWGPDVYMYCFEISATSDASSSGDQVLSTLLTTAYGAQESERLMRKIAGGALYWVDYEPDGTATPATETTITIDKETGFLFFSEAVTTSTVAQGWPGDVDTAKLVPITDVTIAMTTLADEDVATVKLWFYCGLK